MVDGCCWNPFLRVIYCLKLYTDLGVHLSVPIHYITYPQDAICPPLKSYHRIFKVIQPIPGTSSTAQGGGGSFRNSKL